MSQELQADAHVSIPIELRDSRTRFRAATAADVSMALTPTQTRDLFMADRNRSFYVYVRAFPVTLEQLVEDRKDFVRMNNLKEATVLHLPESVRAVWLLDGTDFETFRDDLREKRLKSMSQLRIVYDAPQYRLE